MPGQVDHLAGLGHDAFAGQCGNRLGEYSLGLAQAAASLLEGYAPAQGIAAVVGLEGGYELAGERGPSLGGVDHSVGVGGQVSQDYYVPLGGKLVIRSNTSSSDKLERLERVSRSQGPHCSATLSSTSSPVPWSSIISRSITSGLNRR